MKFSQLLNQALKREPIIGKVIQRTTEIDRQILMQDLMNRGVTEIEGRSIRNMSCGELNRLQGE